MAADQMNETRARQMIADIAGMFPDGHVPDSACCGAEIGPDPAGAPEPPPQPAVAAHQAADSTAADAAHPAQNANAVNLLATLNDLAQRANAGVPGALDELRTFMDRHPEIEQHVGDLASRAEHAWLDLLSAGSSVSREALERRIGHLRSEISGDHATTLERLLGDTIVIAHLAHHHAAILEANSGGSVPQAALRFRRAESAQRRYLAAVKTLATLRQRLPAGLAPLDGLRVHDPEKKSA